MGQFEYKCLFYGSINPICTKTNWNGFIWSIWGKPFSIVSTYMFDGSRHTNNMRKMLVCRCCTQQSIRCEIRVDKTKIQLVYEGSVPQSTRSSTWIFPPHHLQDPIYNLPCFFTVRALEGREQNRSPNNKSTKKTWQAEFVYGPSQSFCRRESSR